MVILRSTPQKVRDLIPSPHATDLLLVLLPQLRVAVVVVVVVVVVGAVAVVVQLAFLRPHGAFGCRFFLVRQRRRYEGRVPAGRHDKIRPLLFEAMVAY